MLKGRLVKEARPQIARRHVQLSSRIDAHVQLRVAAGHGGVALQAQSNGQRWRVARAAAMERHDGHMHAAPPVHHGAHRGVHVVNGALAGSRREGTARTRAH